MKWPQWSKEDVKFSCFFFSWSILKTSKFDFINLKAKTNFIINHVLIFNITNINMMIPIIICLKTLLVIFYFYSNLSGYIIYAIA